MNSAARITRKVAIEQPMLLCNGDRMGQAEFHRRYEAYPNETKFELVGGIVYMASPLRRPHGKFHIGLGMLLGLYEAETPGVEALDNATMILGEESEPQPDLALRILSNYGGQSQETEDEYVQGPPELVAEVAHSTRALDMHQKLRDYLVAGVQEYLVLCVEEKELHWFRFNPQRELKPDEKGIQRSRIFPGLWINGPALLNDDLLAAVRTLRQGLASPEHAAFVRKLEKQKNKIEFENRKRD
jgi:Uma2 family endonuclease